MKNAEVSDPLCNWCVKPNRVGARNFGAGFMASVFQTERLVFPEIKDKYLVLLRKY